MTTEVVNTLSSDNQSVCPVLSPFRKGGDATGPRPRLPHQPKRVVQELLAAWYAVHPAEREAACKAHGTSAFAVRAVLGLLVLFVHRATGDCFPTQETLTTHAGCCVKTIMRTIRALEACGIVEILKRDDAWDVYGEDRPDTDLNRYAYRFPHWMKANGIAPRPKAATPRPVRLTWERRKARTKAHAERVATRLRQQERAQEFARQKGWRQAVKAAQVPVAAPAEVHEKAPPAPVSPVRRTEPLSLAGIATIEPVGELEQAAKGLYERAMARAKRTNPAPWADLPPAIREGWVLMARREASRVHQFEPSESKKTPAEQGDSDASPAARLQKTLAGIARIQGSRTSAGALPREIPPKAPQ